VFFKAKAMVGLVSCDMTFVSWS